MEKSILIPETALKYILFQRTDYLRFSRLLQFLNKFVPLPLYNLSVFLECQLGPDRIKYLFNKDMIKEYELLVPYLPERLTSILDIGCGVAGIDVLLYHHFVEAKPHIFLLDKSKLEDCVYYYFKDKGAFYNSLKVAKNLLKSNGVPEEKIFLLEATDNNEINTNQQVDFVLSLISWGHHYPVSTYIDQVYALLADGGSLILDVRKTTEGKKQLEQKFTEVITIYETRKSQRILARKL